MVCIYAVFVLWLLLLLWSSPINSRDHVWCPACGRGRDAMWEPYCVCEEAT